MSANAVQTDIADMIAMARRGDYASAHGAADALIARQVNDARVYHVRAVARDRNGQPAEALLDFERARRLAPQDIGILNTLALCLMRLGRNKDAIEALNGALAIAPQFAQSHYNRGLACMAEGYMTEAVSAFERAVALNPQHHEALARLALLGAHRGSWTAAREFGARALAINQNSPNALRALAEAVMASGAWRSAEERLRTWLTRAPSGSNERHHAFGLLGDALDGQQRYDEAFQAYQASASEAKALNGSRTGSNSTGTIFDTLESLRRFFSAMPVRPRAGHDDWGDASPSRGHVFLIGFMRSGTTLLEQSLANHPDIVTLEEREALEGPTQTFLSNRQGLERLFQIDAPTARQYRAAYWQEVRAAGVDPAGKILLDKNPFNAVKLPLIVTLFPNAKIIFALRDPRDVVLSCFRHRLRMNAFTVQALDLASTARLYDAYMALTELYTAKLDVALIYHRHEALVDDFEATMRALCARLDLPWNEALRDVGARVRQGLTASQSSAQIGVGVNSGGVARWRHYDKQLRAVAPILDPWVAKFGYASG